MRLAGSVAKITAAKLPGVGVGVGVGLGVGVAVGVAVGVGLGGIVAVAVALGSTVAVGVNVAVAVGVGVNVAVAVAVGVKVAVAVGVGVKVAVAVAVGVAVAVAVGVRVAVGVGVGLIVLAVCMAIISLSDKALFQIAACWMLPLAYAVVMLWRRCIKLVRLHVLPVARVAVAEPTLAPSTKRVNAVPLRRNVTECQFPSNAVPPDGAACVLLLPRATALARVVDTSAPMFARLLADAELEIDTALTDAKSVPPLSSAKNVKFWLSKLGITESVLEA